MGNSVLCIAKSSLLLLCGSHKCCNVFIASVTIHYLSCIMGAKCRSPRLLGSGLGKWGCPSERWSICLMLNCSLMNTPDGILRGLNALSSCTACSYMLSGRGREVYLLRLMANPTPARSRGNLIHCTTGGLLDLSEGNLGPVP